MVPDYFVQTWRRCAFAGEPLLQFALPLTLHPSRPSYSLTRRGDLAYKSAQPKRGIRSLHRGGAEDAERVEIGLRLERNLCELCTTIRDNLRGLRKLPEDSPQRRRGQRSRENVNQDRLRTLRTLRLRGEISFLFRLRLCRARSLR